MEELTKILWKGSKVWRKACKSYSLKIEGGKKVMSIFREDIGEIMIIVPEDLPLDAKLGAIIFELYGILTKSYTHIEHLINAYKRSTLIEKMYIWKAAVEYLGGGQKEKLEERTDYGYWRLFKI